MQTFLPYPDFVASARCLDYKRLGKQRVECAQIINALCHGKGWSNHPATRMWRGYELALGQYQRTMILEWIARGYNNSMAIPEPSKFYNYPHWFFGAVGDAVYASHCSNLLRKDPEYYSQFGWTELHDLPYIWPVD